MHDDERSVHTSRQYAARQRETVTCLRDNGINKAGFSREEDGGSELARSATVPPIVSS